MPRLTWRHWPSCPAVADLAGGDAMSRRPTMVNRARDYLEHRRALGFALDVSGEVVDAVRSLC